MSNRTAYKPTRYTKMERRFGKCRQPGCKFRRVVEGSSVNGVMIYWTGNNDAELQSIGVWCPEHRTGFLDWNQLKGRYSAERECNGVCMGAVGPSCDCQCGGENHGKNHL